MGEGLGHLSQEERDALALEIRTKRRERDEARAAAHEAETQKISNLLRTLIGSEKSSRALYRKADSLHQEARQTLEKARKIFIPTEITDESDKDNLLSDTRRNISLTRPFISTPYSFEGFAENPARQAELARYLIQRLGIRKRGPLLDVGFGANLNISRTFSLEEIPAFAVDANNPEPNGQMPWQPPRKDREENGVEVYYGDIAEINEEESELKDNRFGLILFNGSWMAGGNNWTVAGEVLEAKYYDRKEEGQSAVEFLDKQKDEILSTCRDRLTDEGLIGVVSSRYAFHGAGYEYGLYPEEKLSFVDLYERFVRLGAKKIYIFGVSQEGFDKIIEHSLENQEKDDRYNLNLEDSKVEEIRQALRSVDDLPEEDVFARDGDDASYQRGKIRQVKESARNNPAFGRLARIDAIFAEF